MSYNKRKMKYFKFEFSLKYLSFFSLLTKNSKTKNYFDDVNIFRYILFLNT